MGNVGLLECIEGFSSLLLAVEHLHHLIANEKWVGELHQTCCKHPYKFHVTGVLTIYIPTRPICSPLGIPVLVVGKATYAYEYENLERVLTVLTT